ncbi:nuclear transport factor 2 family protein [Hymenobacter sp. DH14]|uniref:Nuclear transport factor 2 family protein n=1 Tax=Hymenobacter cyanobacteriorum TaxID=2926463 RepID=A0A9X1VIL7_9BACT|nr:nuclear transport factor 2 family protein [Hymenobacter cyanobacteriorum]MCI1187670.1 nuclear transport factor 2 family protein [Hymenobacter cyanobacteriorum]
MKLLLLVATTTLLSLLARPARAQNPTPEQLVQQQVDGWNAHDAAAFAAPYADTTALYIYPNQVLKRFKTHDDLQAYYASLFKANPRLHCEVANKMVLKNTVILHEKITGLANRPDSQSLVIYRVEQGKIVSVRFVLD